MKFLKKNENYESVREMNPDKLIKNEILSNLNNTNEYSMLLK